jgi:hypothetical protein
VILSFLNRTPILNQNALHAQDDYGLCRAVITHSDDLEFNLANHQHARVNITEMRNGPALTKFTAVFIFVFEFLLLIAHGQSASLANGSEQTSDVVLPRNFLVPINTVNRFFPEVTREASTGRNLTAVASPKATRSVIYTNRDTSKKVTITVDEYLTASAASSAYQEAVSKSKTVPGFKPMAAEDLGENGFVGTVTQEGETHVGVGALHGTIIVGATLAGYDPTPENTAKLISLTHEEQRVVTAAMTRNRVK